jgi:heme-degrading monooxygenase HmoA
MHLAELNISKWKVDPQSPEGAGFTDNVERVNTLAERSDGFQWRLLEEARDGEGKNPICDGPSTVMTLSTWESAEQLEHFVWNTVHKQIYSGKNQWFDHMESHSFVMWWVEDGHRPTLEEAKERLDYLDQNGDSDHAFGWSHLPHVKLWQTQQCG